MNNIHTAFSYFFALLLTCTIAPLQGANISIKEAVSQALEQNKNLDFLFDSYRDPQTNILSLHPHIELFIEYYLQSGAEKIINSTELYGTTLSDVSERIRIFKNSSDENTQLHLCQIDGITSILEPLLEVIERIAEKPILSLDLQWNDLDKIPDSIVCLSRLKKLNFKENNLTKNNSVNNLSGLSHFENLNLSCNKLTILPVEVTKLTQLKQLCLDFNDLIEDDELFEKLTDLTNLEKLSLVDCNPLVKTISKSFVNLKILDLSGNFFLSAEQIRNFLGMKEDVEIKI